MFSKTTEYALRAAVYLSEQYPSKKTSVQVAETTHTPVRYAARVLQLLVESELALSTRGPNGGFALSREPDQITLLDVIRSVEPLDRITCCPLDLPEHDKDLCPLHKTMDRVAAAAEGILGDTSLASVMEQPLVPLGLSAARRE